MAHAERYQAQRYARTTPSSHLLAHCLFDPQDQRNLLKLAESGMSLRPVRYLSDPVSAGSDLKLEDVLIAPDNLNDNVFASQIREALTAGINRLRSIDPHLASVIEKRMEDKALKQIGSELGWSGEWARKLEIRALLLLLLDPKVREVLEHAGLNKDSPAINAINAINTLERFGFSRNFIMRWGAIGFPHHEKVRAVAVVIAELAYPHCLNRPKNGGGEDLLDQKRFSWLAHRIGAKALNAICGRTDDVDELIVQLQKYISSRIPKNMARFFRKGESQTLLFEEGRD